MMTVKIEALTGPDALERAEAILPGYLNQQYILHTFQVFPWRNSEFSPPGSLMVVMVLGK